MIYAKYSKGKVVYLMTDNVGECMHLDNAPGKCTWIMHLDNVPG